MQSRVGKHAKISTWFLKNRYKAPAVIVVVTIYFLRVKSENLLEFGWDEARALPVDNGDDLQSLRVDDDILLTKIIVAVDVFFGCHRLRWP